MKLSEIFREAQTYLWDGVISPDLQEGVFCCSCTAIFVALNADVNQWSRAVDFLKKCGMDINLSAQFDEFKYGEERQGARFMWLEMLALIAEDEGL